MKNLNKIIAAMAEDILVVMQDILAANDLGDSNLSKEMYTKYVVDGDNIVMTLITHNYIHFLDQGRKPTGNPPKEEWPDPVRSITDWCRRKGIPSDNSTVYAIIQHIHRYGYKGRFFLEDFWIKAENTTYDNLDKLFEEIVSELTEWFNK